MADALSTTLTADLSPSNRTGDNDTIQQVLRSHSVQRPPLPRHPVYVDYASKDMSQVLQQFGLRHPLNAPHLFSRSSMGPVATFPSQLHRAIEACSTSEHMSPIVQWLPHGRAFKVYNQKRFATDVLPQFFARQTAYSSFQRQLNHYGFFKVTRTDAPFNERGAYFHPLFLRGRSDLCHLLVRPKQHRGRGMRPDKRKKWHPDSEPDLNQLPPVIPQCERAPRDDDATVPSRNVVPPLIQPNDHARASIQQIAFRHLESLSSRSSALPHDTQMFGPASQSKKIPRSQRTEDASVVAAAGAAADAVVGWYSHGNVSVNDSSGDSVLHSLTSLKTVGTETLTSASMTRVHMSSLPATEANKRPIRAQPHHSREKVSIHHQDSEEHPTLLESLRQHASSTDTSTGAGWANHALIVSATHERRKSLDASERIDNLGIAMSIEDATAACDPDVYYTLFDSQYQT